MKIALDDVRQVALLARLKLSPEEETAFAEELSNILTYVELLAELDTESIEPTAHVVDLTTPYREDVVTNAPNAEELLESAPAVDGTYLKVPRIIE